MYIYLPSFVWNLKIPTLTYFSIYVYIYFELHTLFHQNPHCWMALHKYLVLNFIYFIRSKEPLLAEQSLWGVKRLAFAVFNVLQSYRLPSFTCATVRNMFYSGDLLSPKGALGQIWVCVFISDVALAPFFLDNFLKVPFPFTARPKCNSNCALNSFSILLYASDTRASAGMCQSSYATQSSADIRTCSM